MFDKDGVIGVIIDWHKQNRWIYVVYVITLPISLILIGASAICVSLMSLGEKSMADSNRGIKIKQ